MTEGASKTGPKRGRLLIIVIVLLAGTAVVLSAGDEQDEIRSLRSIRSTVDELKPVKDDVKRSLSKPLAVHEHSQMRLSRTKRHLKKGQCEQIRIARCRSMSYNLTQFPNLLNHQTQDQAAKVAKKFEVLVNRRCSPLFGLFLCSVLTPPCYESRKPIPPCKELCLKATRSCKHLLKKFSLTLPSAMRCGRLPKKGTSKCINELSLQRAPQCQQGTYRTPETCKNHFAVPWRVQFPNYFGHINEDEARTGLRRFDPILNLARPGGDCLFLLAQFLCRLYVPPCSKTTLPLLPCRELCVQARSQCRRIIEHIGFQWPSDHKCDHFPGKSEAPCYIGPSTGETTKLTQAGKCQVLSIPLCKNVPYNMTVFPNLFLHKTQQEASLEVHRWWPLVERECSPDFALFLCSLYAPLCTTLDTPPLPCRELCLRVKHRCSPALFGLYSQEWPDTLNCERFPLGKSGEVCIDTPKDKLQVTVSPLGPVTGQCEALKIPVCRGLQYSTTLVPNFFGHQTQEEAASQINPVFLYNSHSYKGTWNECSRELSLFVCSLYAPPCSVPRKPCRELCERVRNSCGPELQVYGYPWPERMACDRFSINETDCIGLRTSVRPTTTPIPPDDC